MGSLLILRALLSCPIRHRARRAHEPTLSSFEHGLFHLLSKSRRRCYRHLWTQSKGRANWDKNALAAPASDGLLVAESEAVLPVLLNQLAAFKSDGGNFAVHAGMHLDALMYPPLNHSEVHSQAPLAQRKTLSGASAPSPLPGDVVCGGSGFATPRAEFQKSLDSYRNQLRSAVGMWPVHHLPGNHDIAPTSVGDGITAWRMVLGNQSHKHNYRAVEAGPNWRVLLLDAVDGLRIDTDGHGFVGREQLKWLAGQLEETQRLRKQATPT